MLFGSRFFTSKTNVFSFDYAALRMAASVDFTPRLFKYIVANSFSLNYFLHKLLFLPHILPKNHFSLKIHCAFLTIKIQSALCTLPNSTKKRPEPVFGPSRSRYFFCGSNTLSVNHPFSQCRVMVPPRFSAAARTPRRSLPPWVLRRGRPSAPSSTSCAQ